MSAAQSAAVVPFVFEGSAVRTLTLDGQPWFVGKDVAQCLGYANATDALNTHCRGVAKRYPIVDALGRTQEARIIAEPDLYRLICGSHLPAAQRFEAWVFEEVLPTIRQTGSYSAGAASAATPEQLETVREARMTFGREGAQRVWLALRLPGSDALGAMPAAPRPDAAPQSAAPEPTIRPEYNPLGGRPPGRETVAIMALKPGESVLLERHSRAIGATITRIRKQSPYLISTHKEGAGVRVSCAHRNADRLI